MDNDSNPRVGIKEQEYINGSKPSTNLIIHGHTMRAGEMFGGLKLYEDKEYERYYIIGYCRKYPRNDRMGVNLAMDLGFSPLMRIQEFKRMQKDMFEKCHRFSIEEYIVFCQKEIFL